MIEVNNIYNIDCFKGYEMIEDSSIDLIVTDPPYKTISGGKGKKGDGSPSGILAKNDGKIFKENDLDFSLFFKESYRVLKDSSHMYVMTNLLNLNELMMIGVENGFMIHNLLVWEKNNVTPNRWYMKNCEYIIFFRKGKAKPINNMSSKTVHQFNNTRDRIHPTQKPVELMSLYINNSSEAGDVVLDPFMGSGSTAVASILNNRNYIGFELDKEYFDSCLSRIQELNNNKE